MSATPAATTAHPLLAQLATKHGFVDLVADTFDAFANAPGRALVVFTEDPARFKETLDLAVIVPEIARAFDGRFRVGVLLADAAREIAPRYAFRRWPALVMLADGRYVGAIDGLRNWDEYLTEVAELLVAQPTRPPSIGIAVAAAGAGASTCGH
jgi:hydrogenase-1 operon protein HyaE